MFDADNHMYEATDAFTRYLPDEVRRRDQVRRDQRAHEDRDQEQDQRVHPEPDVQQGRASRRPGARVPAQEPDSTTAADKDIQLEPPPKYIEALPGFFDPEARIMLMDDLGIDRAMMWPTLASLLEERLADDPVATHVVIHAFNQWMHEQWTFNFENRIFPTPVITLPDRRPGDRGARMGRVQRGAKAILVRPAPVPDFNGRRRSFALPEFDPFWEKVQEADVVVGMHASDSGLPALPERVGGPRRRVPARSRRSSRASTRCFHADNRMISDVVASIIGHGLATRFPNLRIMPVENGSAWVRPLVEKFQKVYERVPQAFDEDPMEAFKRCIYVHPFHEEDPIGLVDLIGADNVVFGSDFPHPEGMFDPVTFVDQLEGLAEDDKAKVMGGNLARIMKVPVAA